MNQCLVYTLNPTENLGCFPEAVIVDLDDVKMPASSFVKLTTHNKHNYKQLINKADEVLLNCCFRLEKSTLISKISVRNIQNWDDMIHTYFENMSPTNENIFIRDYMLEHINREMDCFFKNISSQRMYFPAGHFPFMWKLLDIEEEMPELFYRFDLQDKHLKFSLDISCGTKHFDLKSATLVSRQRARVLLQNKIYEFDEDVNGAKLIPFLSKDAVLIPPSKVEDYLKKIVIPLISTKRVLAQGFEILNVNELSKAIFRVKEIRSLHQPSLFDDLNLSEPIVTDLVFELIFEYQTLWFWAGKQGVVNRLENVQDSYLITHVERDTDLESQYIEQFSKLGLGFDGKVVKMPYNEAAEWLNVHYKQIELLDVEIRFDQKQSDTQRIFMGERSLSLVISEQRDWFDLKGSVKFGDFEIPFILILQAIKQGRLQLILPNGDHAPIPESWFQEFGALSSFYKIENGEVVIPKQFCQLAAELSQNENVHFSATYNMRKLLEGRFEMEYSLPTHFKAILRPYQEEGYRWLRLLDELNLGGCLADDMGLGKTVQTLCLLEWMRENNRGASLLVVPTSLIYNWQAEAKQFCPDLKIYVHSGANRSKDTVDFGFPDIVLTSYALLRRDIEMFKTLKFNYVILDEAQIIKNPQSNTTQASLMLKADHYLTLTGTPIENSLTDLWSQFHFINRNMLGSMSYFVNAIKHPVRFVQYRQLIQPFLLRRTKSEVLTELPEKSIFVQTCSMSTAQSEFYNQTRNFFRDKYMDAIHNSDKLNTMLLLEGLLRLRQSANHPVLVDKDFSESSGKFETVAQMLDDVIAQGDKVLVYSSFVEHLKLYCLLLDEKHIPYCYLDGSTVDRKQQVELFQNDDKMQVFLLSLKAGGLGLNLTKASYVFLLDPWWNPAVESQAFDRAHRMGQKNKVFVYKFITQSTIEEKILKLQDEKRKLFNSMIESESSFIKQLNVDDIMRLVE